MYKLLAVTIVVCFSLIRAHSWVADSIDEVIDPCVGYWKLSYQHPDLVLADSLYVVERFSEALPLYQAARKDYSTEGWTAQEP